MEYCLVTMGYKSLFAHDVMAVRLVGELWEMVDSIWWI